MNNPAMDTRHLEFFVAVADELSFTRAADRVQAVQSTVSAGIRALERQTGRASSSGRRARSRSRRPGESCFRALGSHSMRSPRCTTSAPSRTAR